jgi:hypothetical protein
MTSALTFREEVIGLLREDRKRFARENERLCIRIRELEGRQPVTQDDLIKQDVVENIVRNLGLTPTIEVCAAYREGFERALRRVGCMDGTVKMLLNEEQK